MGEQGHLEIIGVPQFATAFEALSIPDEIHDEIFVINSIYGDGTWEVETTYIENSSTKIRTRLRPPMQGLPISDDGVPLNIVLPSTYPHQRPEFKGVEKWGRLRRRDRNINILVFLAVHRLFEPGSVCMFDILQHVADRSILLDDNGMLDASKIQDASPELSSELQWTLWKDLDTSNIADETSCTICMDEGFAFRMVPLPCGCHYCMDCFTAGWNVALRALEPYTCCLEQVPLSLIESRVHIEPEDTLRYTWMLITRDTAHPFYCGHFRGCGKLIGGFDAKALRVAGKKRSGGGVLCRSCGRWSCVKCRKPSHNGDCITDQEMVRLFKATDIRRCPNCSEAIEKNGGCPKITCRTCDSRWWWEKNGELTPFRSYAEHENED